MRLGLAAVALVVVLGACSRRGSLELDIGALDGPVTDRWIPPDQVRPPDLAPDAPPPPPGCSALAGFAKPQRLTPRRAKLALFATKLDRLVLLDTSGVAVAISLPDGKETTLLDQASAVQWLDKAETSLLVSRDSPIAAYPHYDLWQVAPDGGGGGKLLAKAVCRHWVFAGANRLLTLRDCSSGIGTLELLQVATGAKAGLAQAVSAASVVVSEDGKWAAFVSGAGETGGCHYRRGTAQRVDSAGQTHIVAAEVLEHSLGFLPGSSNLLLRTLASCNEAGIQLRLASGATPPTLLAQGLDFGFPFFDRRYSASPDGKLVLGAQVDMVGLQNQLHAVATDGSGTQLLAGDLFPYQAISMAFWPWACSSSGDHVVYATVSQYPTMGLAAVAIAKKKVTPLAASIHPASYVLSRTHDQVAFLEPASAGAGTKVWLAQLASGASQMRYSSTLSVGNLRFVPDGRGLLLTTADPAGKTVLFFASGTGSSAGAVGIGGWQVNNMAAAYRTDPAGCAVAYDSDQEGGGTLLALIPR